MIIIPWATFTQNVFEGQVWLYMLLMFIFYKLRIITLNMLGFNNYKHYFVNLHFEQDSSMTLADFVQYKYLS